MIDEQSLAMASSGRLSSELDSSTLCWQFEQNFIVGESRWVNMPTWFALAAENGYEIHQDVITRIARGDPRHPFPWSKFTATYRESPDGPIEFQFTYENTYFMTNTKTGEICRIRRNVYVVTAP